MEYIKVIFHIMEQEDYGLLVPRKPIKLKRVTGQVEAYDKEWMLLEEEVPQLERYLLDLDKRLRPHLFLPQIEADETDKGPQQLAASVMRKDIPLALLHEAYKIQEEQQEAA
jgi:hypothetical protein